jgi:hypothetical protein
VSTGLGRRSWPPLFCPPITSTPARRSARSSSPTATASPAARPTRRRPLPPTHAGTLHLQRREQRGPRGRQRQEQWGWRKQREAAGPPGARDCSCLAVVVLDTCEPAEAAFLVGPRTRRVRPLLASWCRRGGVPGFLQDDAWPV